MPPDNRANGKPRLPESVFAVIPALYPHFVLALEDCGLTGPQFFAMSYMKHFGRDVRDHKHAVLLAELTAILRRTFGYSGGGGVNNLLKPLIEEQLIIKLGITQAERSKEFADCVDGNNIVYYLAPSGKEKLSQFNELLHSLYSDFFSNRKRSTILQIIENKILNQIDSIAPDILKYLHDRGNQQLSERP